MNDEMSAFSIIKSVASRGLADQIKHEGDRVDGRGILICGKCGEPRQMFKSFPNPTKEDPQHRSTIKVVVMCRCERDEGVCQRVWQDSGYPGGKPYGQQIFNRDL